MANAVATAASTALPPSRSTVSPASLASGCADDTIPFAPTARLPRSGARVGAGAAIGRAHAETEASETASAKAASWRNDRTNMRIPRGEAREGTGGSIVKMLRNNALVNVPLSSPGKARDSRRCVLLLGVDVDRGLGEDGEVEVRLLLLVERGLE